VVGNLRQASLEGIPHLRSEAVNTSYKLLAEKPEGEKDLLKVIVNKIGDPERKVATKAVHLLNSLLSKHPAMKTVVLRYEEAWPKFWPAEIPEWCATAAGRSRSCFFDQTLSAVHSTTQPPS